MCPTPRMEGGGALPSGCLREQEMLLSDNSLPLGTLYLPVRPREGGGRREEGEIEGGSQGEEKE